MTHSTLLSNLTSYVDQFVERTSTHFIALDELVLNKKPDVSSWSALECFEHLNRYNRYYNPILRHSVTSAPLSSPEAEVKSTWLGRKFIRMMEPDNTKKQKTFRRMDPSNSVLTIDVIREFLNHQNGLAQTIRLASDKDLNQRAVPVEFFRLLKLSPAEALQFVIVHQQRHFLQLERILKNS
jgi:hypothetical protein